MTLNPGVIPHFRLMLMTHQDLKGIYTTIRLGNETTINMNVLINNFTPYFPHLKGVKVGKGESETLVFGRFEKPLEATTTKKKKKKEKVKGSC